MNGGIEEGSCVSRLSGIHARVYIYRPTGKPLDSEIHSIADVVPGWIPWLNVGFLKEMNLEHFYIR